MALGCCCCKDGAVIDRWLNTTKVRPNEDSGTPGSPHYTCDPFARFVEGIKEAPSHEDDLSWCEDQTGCTGCGGWLAGADMNGYSAQDTDLVDKIMACAGEDATHRTIDHNCYEKSGTVDTKGARRGGRWVLGKKFWHGAKGYFDRDDPNLWQSVAFEAGVVDVAAGFGATTNQFQVTPPQVRYRTHTITTVGDLHRLYNGTEDYSFDVSGTSTVGQLTGIESRSGGGTFDIDFGGFDFEDIIAEQWGNANKSVNEWATYFTAWATAITGAPYYYVQSGATYQLWSGGSPDYLMEQITVTRGGGSRQMWNSDGDLTRSESLTLTNTGLTYTYYKHDIGDTIELPDDELTITTTAEFTDPYTAGDCLQDFYAALRAWSLSASNLHYISAGKNWRRDETLGLAPLVIYDEVSSARTPSPSYGTVDLYDGVSDVATISVGSNDYSLAQDADDVYGRPDTDPEWIPTWHKRAWLDDANYLWLSVTGKRFNEGEVGSMALGDVEWSTLLTPLRTGEIIAAGIEGGERLFWPNADNYERVHDTDLGDPSWHWNQISNGALSDTRLPEAARRWMNLDEAQYDAAAYRGVSVPPPSGNYPQSFLRQQNGVLVGAKYVEAVQSWDAVNFDYPCGDARFDVDQTTVCCLVSGDAATGFRVKRTGNATSTPSSGQNILVEGDGIYLISSVDSHGGTPAEWTLHVGAKIEDVAAGRSCLPDGMVFADPLYADGATHIGSLRWWTASPTTCVTNTVSNKTGVKFAWTFNARLAQLATAAQPLWLGGTTAGDGLGLVGCTGLSMSEFTYSGGKCPAVVGWVPHYSQIPNPAAIPNPASRPPAPLPVENFGTNQVLFATPSVFQFDDTYGALWMGAAEMVMPDPFHQAPFKPDCAIDPETESMTWAEDTGSGAADSIEVTESATIYHNYYPHRKWVAARCTIPAGKSLPSGIELFYATGSAISPADGTNVHYDSVSGGIVLGDDSGNYRSIERPWGFTDRACTDNRFGTFYETFTNCP